MRVIRRGQSRSTGGGTAAINKSTSAFSGDATAAAALVPRGYAATNLICANLIRRDALSCVFFQLCPLKVN